MVPARLINGFVSFNRHTHPNERDRSRLWETAVKELLSWWHGWFRIVRKGHLERLVPTLVEEKLAEHPVDLEGEFRKAFKGKGKASVKGKGASGGGGGEVVKGPKSLAKHARAKEGSRDMSAQLFTALCRALGLGARLVFSLQPMDWRAASAAGGNKAKKAPLKQATLTGKPRPGRPPQNGKKADVKDVKSSGGESAEWRDGRGELNYKVPTIRLRRGAPAPSKRAATEGQSLTSSC